MATNLGNIAATASLNIDPFQQSTRVLETQMRSINNALKAQETSFKNNSKSINAQKAQYTLTGKAIDNYSAQLVKQKEKYSGLKQSIGDVNNATADQKTQLLSAEATMNKTIGEIERLSGEYKTLGTQIAISESNWTKAGQTLENVGGRVSKAGDTLNSFGNKWTMGVTAPLVAGVGATVKAAMDWESSFASVKKTNDEVIDSNGNVVYSYKDLEDGLRGLAKELPASHQEIAAVAEAAGQLGIQTENVTAFTKTMIDMGESTNLSAETAATELARFANIVGMSQDKFSNLGSAIVDLGNNYATTESEISSMSLRLAGAGKQIGMSEGDILGFAAALSSVGIESQAGGTAFSKVMVQMQLATEKGVGAFDDLKESAKEQGVSWEELVLSVRDGGKALKGTAERMGTTSSELKKMYKEANKNKTSLEQFADVAGMTGDQFAKMFKSNPTEAIMKFVKGLSEAEKNGSSAIKVLDDMDIKEVRLRDSLLRAANASGIFSDAVETGNKAFGENTALAEEAGKRYETVESQLGMLKNEVTDVAIEFGGPFLQALRDGLQAAKPFIKTIGDLAKKFSEANPETQQTIMKYVGLAAAIGPVSKVMGGFLKITGGGISTVGKLSQWLGKMSGTAKASKTALELAGTGATTFGSAASAAAGSKGVGAMITALGSGGLAGALPAIVGVGGLLALGYGAWKTFGEEAWNSAQRVKKWGTEVSEEQEKVIKKTFDLEEQGLDHVRNFAEGVGGSAEDIVKYNEEIKKSIDEIIEKEKERRDKAAAAIEDDGARKKAEEYNKQQLEQEKKLAEAAKQRVDHISAITQQAADNNRKISDTERKYITENYKQLSREQLALAGFNGKEQLAIQIAYQEDLKAMEGQKRWERQQELIDYLYQEEDSYTKQKEALKEVYGENTKAYTEELDKLESRSRMTTDNVILAVAKLAQANGESLEGMSSFWEEWGYTVEEVEHLVDSSMSNATESVDMFAKGTGEAAQKWNEMALDPKTGEVKTNMADTLVEIAKTDKGWNELELYAKEASLTTNAKEEIAIAMGEAGKWNELSVTDKQLLVGNDPAMVALYDAINELGAWDQYNADRKLLGVDNADAMYNVLNSIGALKGYNELDPELKRLIAEGPAKMTADEARKAMQQYDEMDPALKKLLGDKTDVDSKVTAAKEIIYAYNNNVMPDSKYLNVDTNAWVTASSAQSAMESVKDVYRTIKIQTIMDERAVAMGQKVTGYATGTPYFDGGLAWLGDGGKREPFLTPQGQFGISPAEWTMFNLPKGTKIWSSVQKLMDSLPRYANGTKFDDTKLSRLSVASNNFANPPAPASVQNQVDLKEVIKLLRIIAQKNFIISKDAIGSIANEYAGESFFKLLYNGGGLN